MPHKDQEKRKEYLRLHYQRNKEKYKKKAAKWRAENREKCRESSRKWRKNNNYAEVKRRERQKIKLTVLTHYGGDPPKCACCGESHIEFLCIDHIKGGGWKHFKRVGRGNFYQWLINNDFPKGFQVLCFNCNRAKGFHKTIPFCHVHHPELYGKAKKGRFI